ncbi:hypothetical protein IOC61_04645 [Halomonas sp. KAO]|uniref:hypothetical protein n=1 Tax=unclassified Halomonas TaxID=2609666 RepID=UPI00189D501C|nr:MULTISPECIES: hypothetical protein [unclassified Halomonas]MBF7052603.1 hypothetical protein [Halomonas sp. KAO]MDT0501158.1 hypothetical protein [Halomonas sp. PAR7]MDT0511463.1 hypothetical protein [Halomonas sp. LES1]MDT0590249.1 hypothetical protein [Halomonas sp. PAR8]
MTRRKKTRSLADKVQIRTGRRKDYKKWRHENPDQVTSSTRYTQKKRQQRKLQAARKQARQEAGQEIAIHPEREGGEGPEPGGTSS